ncbi:MAG: Prolipoprotein diacylglyceryl transferase [Firmicutes bacterium]|nr:Prolipoprotein diacylglyceryl transferase [Bacillota bacterium]MDI6707242.1 prolipoprotein diacylglyceryl transferase [Bacillota bacterium]
MNPVAFEIFGLSVRWYGIIMSAGILMGMLIALKEAKRLGMDENLILDLVIFAIPAGIVGARLYYVIFNWDYYSGNLLQIINIRGGGLAIHGTLIAAVITGLIYARVKKVSFWTLADITAPGIILGQAIGRWGNFVNQEAYGVPTDLPWGIMVNGVKVHPTFFYEFLWNMGVFFVLLWFRKRKKVEGEVFLLYVILYSVGRFFIEGLRIDSLMIGSLRMAQVVSLAAVALGAALIVYRRKKNIKKT